MKRSRRRILILLAAVVVGAFGYACAAHAKSSQVSVVLGGEYRTQFLFGRGELGFRCESVVLRETSTVVSLRDGVIYDFVKSSEERGGRLSPSGTRFITWFINSRASVVNLETREVEAEDIGAYPANNAIGDVGDRFFNYRDYRPGPAVIGLYTFEYELVGEFTLGAYSITDIQANRDASAAYCVSEKIIFVVRETSEGLAGKRMRVKDVLRCIAVSPHEDVAYAGGDSSTLYWVGTDDEVRETYIPDICSIFSIGARHKNYVVLCDGYDRRVHIMDRRTSTVVWKSKQFDQAPVSAEIKDDNLLYIVFGGYVGEVEWSPG